MRRFLFGIIISLLSISGCDHNSDLSRGSDTKTKISQINQLSKEMPEEMPEDFNFSLSYGYGEVNKNEINTYNNSVTKDLIIKGTAKADFSFSQDEMQSIYKKMKEINIMRINEFSQQGDCAKTPSNTDSWKITINSETKTFSWTDQHCSVSNDEKLLLDLRTYIQLIVNGKDVYKALPEAEGGYD
ncbi:hypothetical protein [Paenibacillus sp. An7]|uniref:hypothetical protein n=1 Tax=Paenibacillus sp. An7 TaxID=2689577 RepID=UPI00135C3B2E|nr:hypothetical protein [Paenibacillus sp. An7]